MSTVTTVGGKRRLRPRFDNKRRRAVTGLLFISPFIIGLLLIFLPAMIKAVQFSLSDMTLKASSYDLTFVGLKHFKSALFSNTTYVRTMLSSLSDMALNVLLILMFSLFIAILINQNFKGRTVVRAIFFLPVIISAGIIVKLDFGSEVLNVSNVAGAEAVSSLDVARFLLSIGIPPQIVEYVSTVISRIYQTITDSGVQILIFLATLQTIPSSLYEASAIEGATGWENFWKITFPMLSPFLLTNAVYTVVDSLGSYKSGILVYILNFAAKPENMMASVAMSMMFFLCEIVVLMIIMFVLSRVVFYYD